MDLEPNEAETYTLFETLREHVVEVAADFGERVSAELTRIREDSGSGGLLSIFSGVLLDTINLATSMTSSSFAETDDEGKNNENDS